MNLPRSYTEAITGTPGDEWMKACDKEIVTLVKMRVWERLPLTKNQVVVSTKWVFAYNLNTERNISKKKS